MFASRPVVHPLEVAAPADPVQPAPGVLMKDLPGMPGTPGGLGLRVLQLLFAAISLAAMSSTVDFASVSAFRDSVDLLGQNDNFTVLSIFVVVAANSCLRYLIATTILQCVWSLTVAIVDIYALLVKRCLRNRRAVALFAIGDGITWAGSFSGACMAAGVTVLIDTDLNMCYENHCANFQTAVAMEFMCCFSLLPSFLLNLYSIASSRG